MGLDLAGIVASIKDRRQRLIVESLLNRGILPSMLSEDYYTEDETDALLSGYQPLDDTLTELATGSTLTDKWIPRGNGFGGLYDSGLNDNDTRIKSSRSAFYLGGDDLSVERSAAGKMLLRDPSGGVTTPMLQFGGTTSSFPGLRRQGAASSGLELRTADDSGQADLDANALYIVSRSVRFNSTGDGLLLLRDSAASSFGRIMLGGTTSSFPAIKRNGAGIEFKTADDAAFVLARINELAHGGSNNFNLNATGLWLQSTAQFAFGSGSNVFSGLDTGLARSASGVVKVTDGSSGYGKLDASELRVSGTNIASLYQPLDSALTDIAAITLPGVGDVIQWDGANWIAGPSGGSLALDDLSDVDAPLPSDGDVLTWSFGDSAWIASAPSGGSGLTQPQVMARAFGGC